MVRCSRWLAWWVTGEEDGLRIHTGPQLLVYRVGGQWAAQPGYGLNAVSTQEGREVDMVSLFVPDVFSWLCPLPGSGVQQRTG